MATALPRHMQVAVYEAPHEIRLAERPVPEPGPNEALIEVSHCGICGTDLHMVLEGMGRPGSVGGHEYSGRIAATGSEAGDFQPGDAIVYLPQTSCGNCGPCRAGRPSLCAERPDMMSSDFQGAFAKFTCADTAQLVRIPPGLGLREAAITEPLAVALHGISRAGVTAESRVLVTGAGPIGAFTVAALRARGVSNITVSEPAPLRRELAVKLGAKDAVDPESLEIPVMPFHSIEKPFDVAIECSGNPRAMEAALAQLRGGGTLVLVGTGMKRPKFDHNRILLNEIVVTGAFNYDADGFEQALSLLAEGRVPVEELIEPGEVSLAGLLAAIEGLAAGQIARKVLVVPE